MAVAMDSFVACDSEWNGTTRYGWLSPRVSFSQDFVMVDRTSPEKRKRNDEADKAECSSDFEFSMAKATLDLLPEASMLPADELFSNGKLIPLHLLPSIGWDSSKDKMEVEQQPWSMPQHLAFEKPRCSSMSLGIARAGIRRSCVSLENSRCSSPSRSFSLPLTTPSSPKAPRHSRSRIKDFFKTVKLHAPPAQTAREPVASSSRRKPLSARYFWPFSRSNSAGERKTTPSPVLPCRSNSAGESKTTSSCLLPLQNIADVRQKKCSVSENGMLVQSPKIDEVKTEGNNKNTKKPSAAPKNSCDEIAYSNFVVAASEIPCSVSSSMLLIPPAFEISEIGNYRLEEPSNNKPPDHLSNSDIELRDAAKEVLDLVCGLSSAKEKGDGSPGRLQRRPLASPVRKFGKGSPGRRVVSNAALGKLVLKNLERCSARSKVRLRSHDVRSLERQRSYSASVRVAPVLNVPTCIGPSTRAGKASKNKLLSLFWRKEKQPDISFRALPVNKWRK